jgi:methionyl-tRNA formyltransferase
MKRTIFFGMNGEFSLIALRALLTRGANVVGVFTFDAAAPADSARQLHPQHFSDLPLLPSSPSPNIIHIAWQHHIPVFSSSSFISPNFLSQLNPDLIVVACFPKLLPSSWLAIPKLGCLNLHPSLLPAYRGIAPMFWQFYYGETHTGVTLHFMDDGADTGDIVAQREIKFPDGITLRQADRLTAKTGAELLIDALDQNPIPRRPQPVGAIYPIATMPQQKDRLIPTSWSARRAFNFIRGADEWGPFEVDVNGERIKVREVLRCTLGEQMKKAIEEKGGETKIQFADGVLIAS